MYSIYILHHLILITYMIQGTWYNRNYVCTYVAADCFKRLFDQEITYLWQEIRNNLFVAYQELK